MSQGEPEGVPGTGEPELAQRLAEAEALAEAGDWDRAIEAYRRVLSFDRYAGGAEAKLQWALRMRDTEALYRQGQDEIAAGQFAEARQHLNKARLLFGGPYRDTHKLIVESYYAEGRRALEAAQYENALAALRQARELAKSHYKDTDTLIVQAETIMQKQKWAARPAQARNRGCFLLSLVGLLAATVALAGCTGWVPVPTSIPTLTAPAATGGTPSGNVTPAGGTPGAAVSAAQLQPAQRLNMYKAPPPMTIDVNKSYTATIKTAKGDIQIELYPKDAPQTVNNFVFLARDGFYNGLTFHRVVADFVIQGGDPAGTGSGGPGYDIPPEIKRNHTQGAVAMARVSGPPTTPSSGSQFYITLTAQPQLDGQYTVFGQVTSGMDVVQKIQVGDVIQSVTIQEK